MNSHGFRISSSLILAGLLVTTSQAALCQISGSETSQDTAARSEDIGLGDIVVTAQKREQSIQKVPLSISAFSGETLTERGVTSVLELGKTVPGLQIQNTIGTMQPFLRGIGTTNVTLGNESSVAVYVDGVFFSILPSAFFDLSNVQRIEVLKGPQGTLFGRNSTGGVIHVITGDPTHDPVMRGSIGYGRFNAINANVYASAGLSEKVAMDVAISGKTDNGYGTNLPTGRRYGFQDSAIARSKLIVDASEQSRFILSGFYSWSKVSGQKAAYPGTATTTFSAPAAVFRTSEFGYYNAIASQDQRYRFITWGVNLRAEQDLSFAKLTSITAYTFTNHRDFNDGDSGPRDDFFAPIYGRQKTFTQELQLASNPGEKLEWIAGLYYYNTLARYYSVQFLGPLLFGPGIDAPSKQKATSYAGFAQATYEIVPRLKVTAGIRYTSDKTSASGQLLLKTTPATPAAVLPPDSVKTSKATFKGAINYDITDTAMVYASFSRGYKTGNYNILTYNPVPTDPEELDAFEAGFKANIFDRRLRFNGAAFVYNVKSPQVQTLANGTILLSNAGKARVKGFELEGQAAIAAGLTARFALQYLNSKYKVYVDAPSSLQDPVNGGALAVPAIDAAGNRSPFSPKTTFNVGGDYRFSTAVGEVVLTVDYYRSAHFFFEPDNYLRQDAYDLLSAQAKIPLTENFEIRVWGKNLTGSKYASGAQTQIGPVAAIWTPAPPRTYGVAVDFKF